jgi:predicted site-specific integrase-resolvase
MELKTIGVASKELGVGITTLRDWARAGTVCYSRTLGGRYRWTEGQIAQIKAAMGTNEDAESDPENRAKIRRHLARQG